MSASSHEIATLIILHTSYHIKSFVGKTGIKSSRSFLCLDLTSLLDQSNNGGPGNYTMAPTSIGGETSNAVSTRIPGSCSRRTSSPSFDFWPTVTGDQPTPSSGKESPAPCEWPSLVESNDAAPACSCPYTVSAPVRGGEVPPPPERQNRALRPWIEDSLDPERRDDELPLYWALPRRYCPTRGRKVGIEATRTQRLSSMTAHVAASLSLTVLRILKI